MGRVTSTPSGLTPTGISVRTRTMIMPWSMMKIKLSALISIHATGDTAIKRYHDSDGDGRADIVAPATEPVPYETALLEEMEPQWEAGKILAMRDADTRTIKTWIDPNGNGSVDPGEVIDFIPANADVLRPFLDVATDLEAEDIINFIRGEEVAGLRDRNITIGGSQYVWKLGDIVYSTPTVVSKPMEKLQPLLQ